MPKLLTVFAIHDIGEVKYQIDCTVLNNFVDCKASCSDALAHNSLRDKIAQNDQSCGTHSIVYYLWEMLIAVLLECAIII